MIDNINVCLRINDESIGFIDSKNKSAESKFIEFDTVEEFVEELSKFQRFNILYIKTLLEMAKEVKAIMDSIDTTDQMIKLSEKYKDNVLDFSMLVVEFLRYGVAINGREGIMEGHRRDMFRFNNGKCYALNLMTNALADNQLLEIALDEQYEKYNELAKMYLADKNSMSEKEKLNMSTLYILGSAIIAQAVIDDYSKFASTKVNKKADFYG